MKEVTFTYDVADKDGVRGETCMNITMEDAYAKEFKENPNNIGRYPIISDIINNCEILKGRSYIKGSIKHIAYSK